MNEGNRNSTQAPPSPGPQEWARLLDGLLLSYPVDPAARDLLWRSIAAGLSPPYKCEPGIIRAP